MDERTRTFANDQSGFTLVELLVVILVIGILASIALPAFLNQADKARDTNAKSDVRNAVSQMESCYRSDERYTGCPDSDHPTGDVTITVAADGATYVAAKASGSGTTFAITRTALAYVYSCDAPGSGGCRADSSW